MCVCVCVCVRVCVCACAHACVCILNEKRPLFLLACASYEDGLILRCSSSCL